MSYRDPKIIDDKSGLIIPNAIANMGAQISKGWSANLAATRKENDIEKQRLINGGIAIDKAYAKRTDESYKLQVKGGEAFQESVRKAQDYFNQVQADTAKELLRPQTPERKAELLKKQANAVKQMNNINVVVPKIPQMGQEGQRLMKDGSTIIGYTDSWATLPSQSGVDESPNTQGVMSSYNNAPDTTLLMTVGDDGNVSIDSTYNNGEKQNAYSVSMDTFISDDFRASNPITQTVKQGTAQAGSQLMKGNAVDPKYTQNMQIVTDKVKVMNEDGSWTGDYTATKKQTITKEGKDLVDTSIAEITASVGGMFGHEDYLDMMKNQLSVDSATANTFRDGDPSNKPDATEEQKEAYKNAAGIVDLAINEAAAGTFGMSVQDMSIEGEAPQYRFTIDGKSSVEYAPDKKVSVQKSEQLYNVYKKDFDTAVAAGGDLSSVAKSLFNIDKGLRIRHGKGVVEAYSANIENGVVSITATGVPKKQSNTSPDTDIRTYDLKIPEQRYNFIRLVNPMKELQAREMSQQLATLVN